MLISCFCNMKKKLNYFQILKVTESHVKCCIDIVRQTRKMFNYYLLFK